MVLVLPGREKKPSFGEKIAEGLGQTLQNKVDLMQNQELAQQRAQKIQQLTGMDVSGMSDQQQNLVLGEFLKGQQKLAEIDAKKPEFDLVKNSLIKHGVSPEDADLYAHLTIGGQTSFAKDLLEQKKRSRKVNDQFGHQEIEKEHPDLGLEEQEEFQEIEEEKPKSKKLTKSNIDKEIEEHIKNQDIDLLPSEKVSRGKERYDSGLKQYQEASTKLRSFTRDLHRIGILKDLTKSKKLPSNIGRINVDSEGNLRVPFAASPESQRFIKTLNEFAESAKDTFGSRVTNFDLIQHFRKFPTLLNSEEGIKQVLKQMEIVNQINSVYYKNLKNVYDKAGGVRNIDSDAAERFAEKLSEEKISQLASKFSEIGQFSSLPEASEFKGKKIKDKETGEIFISDGNNWVPAG